MLPRWCVDTVIVKRPIYVDRRGSMVPDWDNASMFEISGCSIQSRTTAQDRDGRVLQITNGAVLYAPQDADIQAGDRIEFDGVKYKVDGAPMRKRSATGALSHLAVTLAEWSG